MARTPFSECDEDKDQDAYEEWKRHDPDDDESETADAAHAMAGKDTSLVVMAQGYRQYDKFVENNS